MKNKKKRPVAVVETKRCAHDLDTWFKRWLAGGAK